MNSPLLDWNAWWAGLCVIGLGSLAGAALPPWRRGRAKLGWAARTAAGVVIVALAVLAAGQVNGLLFHRWAWSIGGALGWVLNIITFFIFLRGRRRVGSQGLIAWAGLTLIGIWMALMLAPALLPPVSYDVLEYHQGIIPHVFERGRFEPIPGVVYTRQPIATEALYTLSAVIEGTPWGFGPGILQWSLIVLGVVNIFSLLRRVAIPAGWRPWIVLALLTHPILFALQYDRLTDWTGVMLLAAGLIALRSRGGLGAAALAGIIAGGAVSAKWTNAGTVAVPLAIMLAVNRGSNCVNRGSWIVDRKFIKRIPVFAIAAFLSWLPWGLWTWNYAQNPFSPFLARLFPTDFWPQARLDFLMQTHGPLSPIQDEYWANLVARLGWRLPGLPWVALALLFTASAAILKRGKPRLRGDARFVFACALAVGLLVSVLMWGQLRHAADRFLAPSILLAMIVIAMLTRSFARGAARRVIALVLALVVVVGVAINADQRGRAKMLIRLSQARFSGQIRSDDYFNVALGATAEIYAAANRLPEGSRLIAINEARRYPFRRPIALASVFDRSPADPAVRGAANPGEIRSRLLAQGYTHILVNEFEQARILAMHTPPGLIGNPELQAMLERNDKGAMVERFAGATEFSVEPLSKTELRAWREFLDAMRAQAIFRIGTRPGMYISKL